MPVIFRWEEIRFHFFSNEGNPREPIHVHAQRADAEAKIWLYPEAAIADSEGFTRRELSQLLRVVEQNKALIEEAWHGHFR
ncbi:MAG: DUF4160 domain-containing protein [Niveispirillum sp.]|uniref:DUF4160 domain-containing protein n=1 Tax=Niveispirillum sp. TaxID=1917217 RepID=UPI0009EAE755